MTKRICALGLLLAACLPLTGRAALELRGLCVTGDVIQLSFSDSGSHQSYGWKHVGDLVEGFRITAYDLKTETASLTDGKEALRLKLETGILLKASPAEARTVTGTMILKGKGGRTVTLAADLKFDQETTLDFADGRSLVVTPTKMADGNYLYLFSVRERNAAGENKSSSLPSVVTIPGGSFGVGVDGAEINFTPATP